MAARNIISSNTGNVGRWVLKCALGDQLQVDVDCNGWLLVLVAIS